VPVGKRSVFGVRPASRGEKKTRKQEPRAREPIGRRVQNDYFRPPPRDAEELTVSEFFRSKDLLPFRSELFARFTEHARAEFDDAPAPSLYGGPTMKW
jgi:hypothetical protein